MTVQLKPDRGARRRGAGRGRAAPGKPSYPAHGSGVYVYGIIPGDIKLDSGVAGVGDPPGKLRIVRWGDVAALVSNVSFSSALGSARDLKLHKEILDASATAVPVLPMRFGAMLNDDKAVENELLAANSELFAAALSELDGLAQYVVKGRYPEETILREVLHENREAARLRRRIRGAGSSASRAAKIRLGEIVDRAIAAKREKDTRALVDRLAPHCEAVVLRGPTHERDAVHVALLANTAEADRPRQVINDLAREWMGRMDLRLLGPMAAYDFVGTIGPEV